MLKNSHVFRGCYPVAVLAAACIGVGAMTSTAQASLILMDGNALFDTSLPGSSAGTSGGASVFRPNSAQSANYLSQQSWHFRIDGVHNKQYMFASNHGNFTQSGMFSSLGTMNWTGLAGGLLNAELQIALADGAELNQAVLTQTMSITNTSQSAFTISLFHYADINAGGASVFNTAQSLTSELMSFSSPGTNTFVHWEGVGADAHDYRAHNSLFNDLVGPNAFNLGSPVSPLSDIDATGAYQWNLTIDPGETVSIKSIISANIAIPAPGAIGLAMVAGLFGHYGGGGRRRRY